jgi:aryl-alcohol dehydrogenase-like predicted oxidoreductase
MKRRKFIKTASIIAPAMSLFPADLSSVEREIGQGNLEKRVLGKSGKMLTMLGFGGIIVRDMQPDDASAIVKFAIDAGVNYFDIAPAYGDAIIKLGPALEPYRKDVFLSCKTGGRKKEDARKDLEKSLKDMRTDHFDLYQLHAVTTLKDVDTILGKGGAMETFLEARNEGKIKLIGFSAHSVEAAMALMNRFDFDTILFPVNFATWYAGNFGPQVLALAQEKKMGILAIKAMARRPWPEGADKSKYPRCWYEPFTDEENIRMGLRFTLSHPVTAALPSGEAELYRIALKLRDRLEPLSNAEVNTIKAKGLSGDPIFKYPAV